MNINTLDWKNFDWKEFQVLIVQIAENIFPDCRFNEYLESGYRQHGIDLFAINKKDGTYLTIQCKKEEKLNKSDLAKIVKDFENGSFRPTSSTFIVATSTNLQTQKMQDEIERHRNELRNSYKIDFECWDRKTIETRLKDMFHLVQYHFGLQNANSFCYPAVKNSFQHLDPVPHYIERSLLLFENKEKDIYSFFWNSKRQIFKLNDLLTNDRLSTKLICLLAEPYNGKSACLQQTVYVLNQEQNRLRVFFIELKKYNVQSIESILDIEYGSWKRFPFKDIVVVLDGLDEVPSNKFSEAANYIHQFHLQYEAISIVFSCRKLFYDQYSIKTKLGNFTFYDLNSINREQINLHLESRLGNQFDKFIKSADRTGIWPLLYNPFYLINIVNEYLQPPHKLPNSKLQVLDKLVDRSFQTSYSRQLKDSLSVKHSSHSFKILIKSLALAMQLAGTNSFTDEQMQQLFPGESDRLLLQHNSLLSVSNDNWSFVNSLFQEHLAASLLFNISFEQIVQFCTIGIMIKKIRIKWVQTVCSLLSLLNQYDPLFKKLIDLIEQDNIELIFQADGAKFDDQFKLLVLKKLVSICNTHNLRPLATYENTIASFVNSSQNCVDYLLQCVTGHDINLRTKIVCARILQNCDLTEQSQKVLKIVLEELNRISDATYAGNLVDIFTNSKIGDKNLIKRLLSLNNLISKHPFRDSLYELILALDLIDEFYWVGIEGLSILKAYNQPIITSGSERSLEDFVVATRKVKNLVFLFDKERNPEWYEYIIATRGRTNEFVTKLFEKLSQTYKHNPFIIFPVAYFIKDIGRRYLREEFKEVDHFLEKTDSHWIVVRILLKEMIFLKNWQLGGLITEKTYDYILFECEEQFSEIDSLRACIRGLQVMHKLDQAEAFEKLCQDMAQSKDEKEKIHDTYRRHNEIECKKNENDLTCIQSKVNFVAGIKAFFESFGKSELGPREFYIDWEAPEVQRLADSRFIVSHLHNCVVGDKVSLVDSIIRINDDEYFETFRAEEILNYSFPDELTKHTLLQILERYYQAKLKVADFANCKWIVDDQYYWRTMESRLGDIFKKFQFNTDEKYLLDMLWLDTSGTRGLESATLNKTDTLSSVIMTKLTDEGLAKLRKRIVDNFKEGIKLSSIVGTHIALANHLKVVEAKDYILLDLLQNNDDTTHRMDAVQAYLKLEGDFKKIIDLYNQYENYNEYFFLSLTNDLIKSYPNEVEEKAVSALRSRFTSMERKIQIAQILLQTGNLESFQYLASQIRSSKRAPDHMHGHSIEKVNTLSALKEMEDLMYLILVKIPERPSSFSETARHTLTDWIYQLASKSEDDLLLVIDFLERSKERLVDTHENTSDFNWYINKAIEDFRSSDSSVKGIDDIKQLLSAISNT